MLVSSSPCDGVGEVTTGGSCGCGGGAGRDGWCLGAETAGEAAGGTDLGRGFGEGNLEGVLADVAPKGMLGDCFLICFELMKRI